MNLQQLYYFRALAKNEHLHQTAEELFISPPALSTTISRLENELGVKLFTKNGRNICLTEKGRLFYTRIDQILTDLESACRQIQKEENDQSISIWTTTNVSWSNAFAEFIYTHPGIAFNQLFLDAKQIPSIPSDKHPDFIICPLESLPPDKYEYDVLIENDQTVLVVYEGHRFWERNEISLEEIADEPLIMPSSNYNLKDDITKFYRLIGCKPNVVAEADAQLRSQLVRAQKGITLSTKWAIRSPFFIGLRGIPITKPDFPKTQVIAWLKGTRRSKVQEMFVDFIKSYIQNIEELN